MGDLEGRGEEVEGDEGDEEMERRKGKRRDGVRRAIAAAAIAEELSEKIKPSFSSHSTKTLFAARCVVRLKKFLE